jgi:Flp pilus assembly protein TadG
MKRLKGHCAGQIIALTSISMIAVIGFAALAVDIGYMYSTRRSMQTAADAAAIAGANALQSSNSASYQQAASDVATLNGFTNGQNGVTVTVGTPSSGPYSGNSNYVEVDMRRAVPTYFLRVLGFNTLNVAVSATAGTVNGPACVYALDPSVSDAIYVNGAFNINAHCGVLDDSSSSTGLYATGAGNFTATSIGVVGNYGTGGAVTFSPKPVSSIAASPDPLASIQPPSVGTCTLQSSTTGSYSINNANSTVSLTPTVYSGGYSIAGAHTSVIFNQGSPTTYGNTITITGASGVTFNAGQYQATSGGTSIDLTNHSGNVNFASNGSYTFCGAVVIGGSNTVTLSPGLYAGGLFIHGAANVTFNPGTYVLAGGGLTIDGASNLSGTGVTFYDTTGTGGYRPISICGAETAHLSAPTSATSGALEGILFFQDRSVATGSTCTTSIPACPAPSGSTCSMVSGASSSSFDGALYFPTTSLIFNGASSGSGYTFLIADTITFNGAASATLGNNYSSLTDGSPVKSSTLYE